MYKVIKAEFLKQRKNSTIVVFSITFLCLTLILFLWEVFWAGDAIRQDDVNTIQKGEAFSMVLFLTLFRKIWGILYGFLSVHMEFVDNRKEYFLYSYNKTQLWISKIAVGAAAAGAMIALIILIPDILMVFRDSVISGEEFPVITQALLVWMMTLGNIILGMIVGIYIKDIVVVVIITFSLEFFPNVFPGIVNRVWEKLDGYWYFSNMLNPMKEQLEGLKQFSFELSGGFSNGNGLVIWVVVFLAIASIGIGLLKRRISG